MHQLENKVFPSVEPFKDKAYRISETLAGLIPTGSGIFKSLVNSPYEARLESWISDATSAINYLIDEEGLNLEQLQKNEMFMDFVINLSNTAARTSQKEKIQYLQKALVGAAKIKIEDKDEYNFYLSTLDFFSALHLRTLVRFIDIKIKENEIPTLFEDYQQKSYIYDQAINDIKARSLLMFENDDNYGTDVFLSKQGSKFLEILGIKT
jgi:hypothetical protein